LINDFLLHGIARRKSAMELNIIDLDGMSWEIIWEIGSMQVFHKARFEFTSSRSVFKSVNHSHSIQGEA
jgi:hypothetical protein